MIFIFFDPRGCPKIGCWRFPSKSTFYPITQIQKAMSTPTVPSSSVMDPNRSVLIKVPPKHKIMSNGTSYHDTPIPLVPWYPGTMPPRVPWVPLVPCLPRYHGTKVPWYHGTMNFGPSLGGRRPTYPGGLGEQPPREKGNKDA